MAYAGRVKDGMTYFIGWKRCATSPAVNERRRMNSWKYAEKTKLLNPIDDIFFQKMAENREFCEEILRVIVGNPGLCVEYVDVQKNVKNLQGRSVILDAFCKDSKGTHIDIEVQKANDDDHLRRVRYNSACLTVNITDTGEKFEKVPDVCVVLISKKDIFKRKRVVYHVDSMIRETGEKVDDGLKRIFVNTEVKDESRISRLMTLFTDDDAYDDEQFPKTSERKRWFKKNPKGEEEMCDIVREIAEAERAEGIKEGIKEGKQAFVSTLKELGVTYSDTLCKLREKFQLDEQTAEESMKLYWK